MWPNPSFRKEKGGLAEFIPARGGGGRGEAEGWGQKEGRRKASEDGRRAGNGVAEGRLEEISSSNQMAEEVAGIIDLGRQIGEVIGRSSVMK